MSALAIASVTGAAVSDGTRQITPVAILGADGAQFQPAMDAATRPGYQRLSDGTNAITLVNSALVPVAPQAATSGGATPYYYIAAASAGQDAHVVKASAGTLYSLTVSSTIATVRYMKVYDMSTAPASTDTASLKFIVAIPAAAAGTLQSIPLPPCGVVFSSGIGIRFTTGLAANDANAVTANDCLTNLSYK